MAITKCDVPVWLADAVVVMLTEPSWGQGRWLKRLWRDHARDSIDAIRAAEVAGARSHPELPQTWEWSFLLAKHFVERAYADSPVVTPEAIKRSYQRVRRGLATPGKYYTINFTPRLIEALERFRDMMAAQIERDSGKK